MSDTELLLEILANQEVILGNQAAASGGAPPPDTSGEAWIGNDGQRKRNPDYPGWNADLWDYAQVDTIKNVDITDIPQHQGSIGGNYITRYGGYSYDIMIMPDVDHQVYLRSTGSTIIRRLELKNGKHVVVDVCTMHNPIVYTKGQSRGKPVMYLQVSNRADCGIVYNDTI